MSFVHNTIILFEQRLNSGHTWNGADPGTTPVYPKSTGGEAQKVSWPIADVGGLIDMSTAREGAKKAAGTDTKSGTPDTFWELRQLVLKLGGQTAWTLKAFKGSDSVTVLSGTNETEIIHKNISFIVMPGWKLKLESTNNSSSAHFMQALLTPWNMVQHS